MSRCLHSTCVNWVPMLIFQPLPFFLVSCTQLSCSLPSRSYNGAAGGSPSPLWSAGDAFWCGMAHQWHVCCPCWSSAPCHDRRGSGRAQQGLEAPQGHDAGGWTWDLRGLGRPRCQAPASPSEHCALPFNSRGEGVKCKAGCLFGCCWFCYCYFLKPCLLPVPMLGAVPQEPPGLPVVLGHGCVGTERGGCRPLQAVIQNHRII